MVKAEIRKAVAAWNACLKQHFPDSRTVIFPHLAHQFGVGGCVDTMMAEFVERRTTTGLDTTRCDGAVMVPPFERND